VLRYSRRGILRRGAALGLATPAIVTVAIAYSFFIDNYVTGLSAEATKGSTHPARLTPKTGW
jgi:hypothetical protein